MNDVQRKSDLLAASAILLFSCIPAGQMSPAQVSSIRAKYNRSRGNARPSVPNCLLQMEPSRGSAALATCLVQAMALLRSSFVFFFFHCPIPLARMVYPDGATGSPRLQNN